MPNEMNDFIKRVCGGFTLSHILAALRGLEDQRDYSNIEEIDLGDLEQHFWAVCGWEFFDEEDRELKIPLDFTHQLKKQKFAIAKLLGYEPRKLSNCCSASIQPETDICSQCKEHCEIARGL